MKYMYLYPRGGHPVPTFNWVFGAMTSKKLTQQSPYKRAEQNFVGDEKGFHHLGQVVVYIYIYNYTFIIT